MKKINILFALLGLAGILLSNTQGGFTSDYTGSTGLNGTSCGASSCHMGTMGVDSSVLDVRVLNTANVDITKTTGGYALGATYNVEVKLKLGSKVKAGFQCVPLTFMSNLPAGTIQNTVMPSMLQITPDGQNRQYISHTTTGTTSSTVISGGYATWKFKWQAPATDIGALSFHCIANITNNNNLSDGDSVVMATYVIQKPSGVPTVSTAELVQVYPNPTLNEVVLPSSIGITKKVWVLNAMGVMVLSTHEATSQLSLQSLSSGMYFIWVENEEGKIFRAAVSKR